jgi:simple sugar transport system substrate-binding protein
MIKYSFLRLLTGILSLCSLFVGAVFAQGDNYRFVMVSHIGSNDPNMNWLTTSMKSFEEKYPGVKTEYLSTNEYSLQNFIAILNQAIATLTYVGGDEYLTGLKLGERVVELANAGKIPKPTRVMCANHDATHQGLKARARWMTDAMKKIGVPVDELIIGADPAQARSVMQSYLSTHKDVNYIFWLASWSSPWAYSVADQMGLKPKLADKGLTIVTVDESPDALEGIKDGKVLACHSQGFWLQGYLPMEILYFYKKMGMNPLDDVITGPIVIDQSNVDQWIKFVKAVIGEDAYKKQLTW